MNITLIQFAVQSIVRLASVGKQAAEQRSRNETALLPGFAAQEPNRLTVVNGFFTITDEREAHVKDGVILRIEPAIGREREIKQLCHRGVVGLGPANRNAGDAAERVDYRNHPFNPSAGHRHGYTHD